MSTKRNQTVFSLVWLLFALLAIPNVAFSQSQSIVGTVTDSSGAVIPGATVTATNADTGIQRQAITNSTGLYSIANLGVGAYIVAGEAQGFQKQEVRDVRLEVQSQREINLILKVGTSEQQVTVNAMPTALQTEEASVGGLVETEMVQELPLNARDFIQLQLLTPGVASSHGAGNVGVDRIDAQSGDIGGGLFSVGGMRDDYNEFLLDDVSFRENLHGGNAFNPAVDAIDQFRTQTGDWSAQYGAMAGGLVNVVTKSGGNQFHGTAYEFTRNNSLDALAWATKYYGQAHQPQPPLHLNQFGGTVGGPIFRNKAFFFGSYDEFLQNVSSTYVGSYPDAKMQGGDFSDLLTAQTPIVITDPLTGQPFSGNIIPQNRIVPGWAPYFKAYIPLPNSKGIDNGLYNNYIVTLSHPNSTYQGIGRIDYQFSPKTSFSFHMLENRVSDAPPFFAKLSFTQNNKDSNYMASLSHTFSPNTILMYHGGLNLWDANVLTNTANGKTYPARDILGIGGLATDPRAYQAPYINVSMYSQMGSQIVQAPREWKSQTIGNHVVAYITRGRHNIATGFDLDPHYDTFPEIFIGSGLYNFPGVMTGYGFADMLLGLPSSFLLSPELFNPEYRYWNIGPWVQDGWRVTPNLTVNVGLRYDLVTRPVSGNNTISDIRLPQSPGGNISLALSGPCKVTPISPCTTPQSIPTSVDSNRSLINGEHTDFAPRVGLSYKIGNKTVARAGYGIFYQNEPINQWIFLSINPPYVQFFNQSWNLSDFQTFDWSNPVAGLQGAGVQFTYIPKDYKNAYLQSYNLAVQRELPYGMVLDAAYVGNKDTHLVARTWPNQPAPGPGPVQPRRPYPNVSTISGDEPVGSANYNALQVKLEKRYSQGLALLSGYTWGKALTDSQTAETGELGAVDLQNNFNRKANYGLFTANIKHRFTASAVYDLPFGPGKTFLVGAKGPAKWLIDGWQAGAVIQAQTGYPATITDPYDVANVGDGVNLPNVISNPNKGPKTQKEWFDTKAFQIQAPYTFGNEHIGQVILPGFAETDLSAVKNTHLTERINLQIRAEFFNAFNNADLTGVDLGITSPTFGQVLGQAIPSREIQLGAHVNF